MWGCLCSLCLPVEVQAMGEGVSRGVVCVLCVYQWKYKPWVRVCHVGLSVFFVFTGGSTSHG